MMQPVRQEPPTLTAALEYARRGWPVFPLHSMRGEWCTCGDGRCSNKAKHPLTRNGLKDASTDEQVIRDWWRRWGFANVGIRTGGGIFVLDVDVRHQGDETLAELEREHGDLPAAPRVTTGGGGAHIWFKGRAPSRSNVAHGIDVRGDGGYVVAPPSLHESGKRYEWELAYHPDEIGLADPPPWLSALVTVRRAPVAATVAGPDKIIEGGRNTWLTSVAGKYRRAGMSAAALEAALRVTNQERCHPPLDDKDVHNVARSIGGRDGDDLPKPTAGPIGVSSIFAPLPPIVWLCELMRLTPGAPIVLGGYGWSGKTLIAQHIALCVASGRRLFGLYECKRGRVLHDDREQGFRLTAERYQRQSRAQGIEPCELDGNLSLLVDATHTLDQADAEDVLSKLVDGYQLCILDSLRPMAPSLDENSSEFRRALDVLKRVSDRTGCVFVVIHHARKPKDGEEHGGERFALRGSSGIYDACAAVWCMASKKKGEPIAMMCTKDRVVGNAPDDFYIRFADVPKENDPRWGLLVAHVDAEQFAEERKQAEAASLRTWTEKAKQTVVAFLRKHAGVYRGSRKALFEAVELRYQIGQRAVDELTREHVLLIGGTYREPEFRLAEVAK